MADKTNPSVSTDKITVVGSSDDSLKEKMPSDGSENGVDGAGRIKQQTHDEQAPKYTEETATAIISNLSLGELRAKLVEYGADIGPIGPSMRHLFEKKLLRLMTGVSFTSSSEGDTVSSSSASSGTSGTQDVDPSLYFAVSVPSDVQQTIPGGERIFHRKEEALKFAKKTPGARFKVFSSHGEALKYTETASDAVNKEAKPQEPTGEASLFRSIRTQDLVVLRKAIEAGDLARCRELIWGNPRYLISSGDSPILLQEGFRYNALHVCAMKNQPEPCRLILSILEDPAFFEKLYPQDSIETRQLRIKHICDLYLNMPDRGNCETPLHFACKFGHEEVIRVLAGHPATDRLQQNKYGDPPAKVICARMNQPPKDKVQRINDILEAHLYVPLLRAVDNSSPAVISKPWSTPPSRCASSQIVLQNSPVESPVTVCAYAGPMSPQQAYKFRQGCMTPPSKNKWEVKEFLGIRRSDNEKGYERIGRRVAHELGIPWQEYWEFLGGFMDLHTNTGLMKLEQYLAAKYESILAQQDLDLQIEQLEAKLKSFHVTSPPARDVGTLDNLRGLNIASEEDATTPTNSDIYVPPHVPPHGFDWSSRTGTQTVNPSDVQIDFGEKSLGVSLIDFAHKPVVWTDIGDVPRKGHCVIHHPDPCQCHLPEKSSESCTESNTVAHSKLLSHTDGGDGHEATDGKESEGLSDNESESTSFHTAASSPLSCSYQSEGDGSETPEETSVFLAGELPSKLDMDVMRAIGNSDLSPINYPNIMRWQRQLLTYSEKERNSWRSPQPRQRWSDPPRSQATTPLSSRPLLSINSPESPSLDDIQTNLMTSFLSVESP